MKWIKDICNHIVHFALGLMNPIIGRLEERSWTGTRFSSGEEKHVKTELWRKLQEKKL